tara:strand:+ start:296 stop:1948 length:1653 start_codon:yes stop_codon:yes gene_type:complete
VFSVIDRKEKINNLEKSEIDLIVIGGGITGAGIALDAVERGMKVVLLEKNDFASGTSSKSTKLIHGGLRYLKKLEIALVKEVGLERKIVHKNARHIVIAEKMLLPIIEKGSLNKFFTNIALWVYDFLANVEKKERRKMLNKKQTIKEEPLLNAKGKKIIGGGLYFEYITDDARLTIETIKKAQELGAQCFNYNKVNDFIYKEEKLVGVKVKDALSDKEYSLKAKIIVNAAGPWVDLLRKKDNSLEGKRLLLTKGIHIVVKHKYFPIKHAIYFETADKRMLFAIPRKGKTYIGTTDTVYSEDINKATANLEDVNYLLKSANKMFSTLNLEKNQIESSWAGLRPLIYEDGKSASEVSRKDEIFISKSGLITIAGGKLSGYRKMAERTVDLVRLNLKKEGFNFKECNTVKLKLSGGDFNNNQEIKNLIIQLTGEVKQVNIDMEKVKSWVYRYGSNTPKLIEIAYNNFKLVEKNVEKLVLLTELIYCIENESISSLSDFMIRRTSRLYFDRPNILKHLDYLCLEFSVRLKLNKQEIELQRKEFLQEYEEAVSFV